MPRGKARVLVVDDEPDICSVICDVLMQNGLDCVGITNSQEAVKLLRERPFDVMVADVFLPGVSGLDLLAECRQIGGCKTILITGRPSTESIARALSLGAHDYLQKPFFMSDLVEAVKSAFLGHTPVHPLALKAATALDRQHHLVRVPLESIRALVRAVEAKDPYTSRHSEQVTHYAVSLARHERLPDPIVEQIRTAATLHDVGKIGIPDAILTKPGKLTQEEFRLVQQHSALGAEILENISSLAAEAILVRHHHENWDGSGYPDRLTGEEIPLGARIINISDAMDAMLMARTYKVAYPVEKMLDELAACAGRQFDPKLAALACSWCRENPDKIIRHGPLFQDIKSGSSLP